MPRGRPVTDETRSRLLQALREGMTRNAASREFGIAAATVTKIAKAEGISFDRAKTAAAVEAHRIDLAASRQLLAEKMMTAAHEMLDDLAKPYVVYNFGGKDNTFNSHEFATPPVEVKRNIMTTAGIAFDKATRIVEKDSGEDVSVEVRQALLDFGAGLKGLFEGDSYGRVDGVAGDGDSAGHGQSGA